MFQPDVPAAGSSPILISGSFMIWTSYLLSRMAGRKIFSEVSIK
jgi:hypothetical protein